MMARRDERTVRKPTVTRVVFQGVGGAYSELAAIIYFGKATRPRGLGEFADVFSAVARGRASYGVIPIENSLTGSIHQNFDLFLKHRLWIVGEVKLRVSHSLLAHRGTKLKELKRVYSHPQGLWQCQGFLAGRKHLVPTPYFDTAGSAKFVAESGDREAAAIASREAGARYGLVALRTAIEDNKQNFTRFLVLQRKPGPPPRVDSRHIKTSLCFALKNVPGALHRTLGAFASQELQVFKIESRPIAGHPWEYFFYLDFEGPSDSLAARTALAELSRTARRVRVLGSYLAAR